MRPKSPVVYVLASRRNGTLYIGVTSDLAGRISVHMQDLLDGFTKRYGVHLLVHVEHCDTMEDAIKREKQLKKLGRADKISIIEKGNPAWRGLYQEISGFIDLDDRS
jgi:putative endonuclease